MSVSSRTLFSDPAHFIALGAGIGLVPVFPGTAASLFALLIFWFIDHLHWSFYSLILVGVFISGVVSSERSARLLNDKDPSCIVIDEIFGMLFTLILIPPGGIWIVIAFVLFRIFDILKPWPVSFADARISGGMGIMLDDLFAGIYALIVIQLLRFSNLPDIAFIYS